MISSPLQGSSAPLCKIAEVIPPELTRKIQAAVRASNDLYLGRILKENIVTLRELEELYATAGKLKAKKLLRACRFVLGIELIKKDIETRIGDLLQTALFIEGKLPDYIKQRKYYLNSSTTNLAYTIEYDPSTKRAFILLEGVQGAYIGRGFKKTVYKSICYSSTNPEIVARASQARLKKIERQVTDLLRGSKGLFTTYTITEHTENGIRYFAIYSKIYNQGAIYKFLENCGDLSLREKMKIALDVLTGITSMHKKKIVHRDLGTGNYLVEIEGDNVLGRRKITTVISDYGLAEKVSRVKSVFAQGNALNLAPEGLFYNTMKGKQYYKTDLFAVGALLYRVFYRQNAPWQQARFRRDPLSIKREKYREFVLEIDADTKAKRIAFAVKKMKGVLTPEEAFEYLILQMVHPDPEKRGSAAQMKSEMVRICKQLR